MDPVTAKLIVKLALEACKGEAVLPALFVEPSPLRQALLIQKALGLPLSDAPILLAALKASR